MHPEKSLNRYRHLLRTLALLPVYLLLCVFSPLATAHGVAETDALFIQQSQGIQFLPYLYLGAKHMVTGYDHLLFLAGVIFFLCRLRKVATYVTLFAAGHSLTLLTGVLAELHINPYLVDAVIGLSVVYKALDNLGAFRRWFGFQPDTRAAVFLFGLFHGFGLATKLQDLALPEEGLVTNILAFNIGVEVGQLLALSLILILINSWRKTRYFRHQAFAANTLLLSAGFMLIGYQLSGFLIYS